MREKKHETIQKPIPCRRESFSVKIVLQTAAEYRWNEKNSTTQRTYYCMWANTNSEQWWSGTRCVQFCVWKGAKTFVLSCQCINHRRHFILFLFIVVDAHIACWLAEWLAWPGLAIFNKTQTVCFAVLVELNIFLSCSHSPPVFDPFAVRTINTCAMRTNTKYKSAKRSLLVKIDTVVSFHFRCECDTMWFDTSTNGPTNLVVHLVSDGRIRSTLQLLLIDVSSMRKHMQEILGEHCAFYSKLEYWCGVALRLLLCFHSNVAGMRRRRSMNDTMWPNTTRRSSNSNRTFVPETDKLSTLVKNINIHDEWRQKPELVFYFIISVSATRFSLFGCECAESCGRTLFLLCFFVRFFFLLVGMCRIE